MTRALTKTTPPRQLLARILEEPHLVSAVQRLEPRVLGKLIEHVGLEDSGELVSLATTDQLRQVFDEDLWRSDRPGKDETFDDARFALWLEIMLEAGDDLAARKLAELDEDLLTLALCKRILVIDIDALAVIMSESERSSEADLTDKALESCLYHELEEYRLIARDEERWDSILSALLALDKEHHELMRRLLDRCCAISTEHIEDNGGLYHVLTSGEMLESDLGAEREDRREREGFVAPSSAASFLSLARVTARRELVGSTAADPVSRAHLRRVQPRRPAVQQPERDEPEAAGLVRLLREADVLPEPHALALLEAPAASRARLMQQAIARLREQDPVLYAERLRELAYLANVLLAGCGLEGRRFRAVEAAEAVVATCSLGLDHLLEAEPAARREAEVAERAAARVSADGAVKLFGIGWNILHHDLALRAARALLDALGRSQAEPAVARKLAAVSSALSAAVASGKVWLARGKLGLLAGTYDPPTLAALGAALDECPSAAPAPRDEADPSRQRSRFIASLAELRELQAQLARALR
jgi:hypothetical protein